MPPRPGDRAGPWWRRLGWLAAIWGASVGALAVVALVIRWCLKAG